MWDWTVGEGVSNSNPIPEQHRYRCDDGMARCWVPGYRTGLTSWAEYALISLVPLPELPAPEREREKETCKRKLPQRGNTTQL